MYTLGEQYVKAITLIKTKFSDKVDKGGHPYIGHLFSVSRSIGDVIDDLTMTGVDEEVITFYRKAEIVALLHDILEDTDTTEDGLREEGFDDDIIQAVVAITRRKDEKLYFDFIERVKECDLAKVVKIYDLEDNMDIKRLKSLEEKDLKRIFKYWHCWQYLRGMITATDCKTAIHPDEK